MKYILKNFLFMGLSLLLFSAFIPTNGLASNLPEPNKLAALEVEEFADTKILDSMKSDKIPGVTIAITYRDTPLLVKSYGMADVENNFTVDSNKSEFAIASISKLFTYMALYQLYEQGKVSMDDDVQAILGIKFQTKESELSPVYIKDLFTHSAGFEDNYLGQSAAIDEETNISLMQYIQEFKPNRFATQGAPIVYNNYSTALAGAVVEKVSGIPFKDYMKQFVLNPLAMNNSHFYDSVISEQGDPNRAVGYFWNGNANIPQRRHFHHGGSLPLAGLKTTTYDMLNFLQYHLDASNPYSAKKLIGLNPFEGQPSDNLPIKSNHPDVGGNAFGFWIDKQDGLISYSHGGNTKGFKSKLVLYPEVDLGIYISTNSTRGTQLAHSFARDLVKHFYPEKFMAAEIKAESTYSLSEYQGLYLSKRRNDSTIEKLATPAIFVQADSDKLVIYTGGNKIDLFPIAEGLFQSSVSGEIVRFVKDKIAGNQSITIIRQDEVLERIKGWQNTFNYINALNYIALASLILLTFQLVSFFRKKSRVAPHKRVSNSFSINATGWLVFFVCLMITMGNMNANYYPDVFVHFPDIWTIVGQVALSIGLISMLAGIFFLPRFYQSGEVGSISKLGYSLFLFMTLIMFIWSNYFNVIGFKF